MTRVLVTGATGFVGAVLCELLAQAGCKVRAALRSDRPVPSCIAEKVVTGDIAAPADLAAALDGVDAVIHAAARTHVLHDSPVNTELYMQINARGTLRLAEAAAQAGVRRFVYLSSIKVNGEETNRGYRARRWTVSAKCLRHVEVARGETSAGGGCQNRHRSRDRTSATGVRSGCGSQLS